MDPLTLTTLTTVGTNLISGAFDFFNRPQIQTPDWGQAAALYSKFMREETGEMEEEALSRARLEAERAGISSGAAYLETVRSIQEQRNRILGREISRFGIQQELAKMQWGTQASLAQYQQDIGVKERTMQRIENIGGAVAGQFEERYAGNLKNQYKSEFENMYGGMQKQMEEMMLTYKEMNRDIQDSLEYFGELTGVNWQDFIRERRSSRLGAIDTYNNNTPAPIVGR